MNLVSILWRVLNKRFEPALKFYFGWQSKLPIMVVTRKQLHNFAHDFCDHSVYETSKAYEAHVEHVLATIGNAKDREEFEWKLRSRLK